MPRLLELYADDQLQATMPEFVKNLRGIPLHLGFSLAKQDAAKQIMDVSHLVWKPESLADQSSYTIEVPEGLVRLFQESFSTPLSLDVESLELYDELGRSLGWLRGVFPGKTFPHPSR